MMRFQSFAAAAAVILPSFLLTPYVAAQGNVTAELMPVRTNETVGLNTTAFVADAALAMAYAFGNLIQNNVSNLELCPNSGDDDEEDNMYNCDAAHNNGTDWIADVTFSFAEGLNLEQTLNDNAAFHDSLPTIIYNAASLMARENTTGICVRFYDESIGEEDFTAYMNIANAANPVYPTVNVTFGAVSFQTNIADTIYDFCRTADYTTGVAPGPSQNTIAAMAISLAGSNPTFAAQLKEALSNNVNDS